MLSRVKYLGHFISAELHPSPGKVKAIVEASTPQNVNQLGTFLGLINYYGKFLPNLASMHACTTLSTTTEGNQMEVGCGTRSFPERKATVDIISIVGAL